MKKQYNFELPKITDLTIEQQAVLNEDEAIALSGGAGTGKSVVSIYRHIKNYDKGKSSILITYTKTLQKYLFQSVRQINPEASKRVHSAKGCLSPKNRRFCQGVDEIIIDEAQDLEYQNIEIIKSFAKNISYGADFNQTLFIFQEEKNLNLSEIVKKREKIFKDLFPKNEKFHLEENFRNTQEIIHFTKAVLPDFKINSDIEKNGKKPKIFIGENDIIKILELLEDYHSTKHNIVILLPFRDQIMNYVNNIKDKFDCSFYYSDIENFTINNIHITTFKSSKGLEFDTVIIPEFQDYQQNIETKYTVNYNDYYVAFTRAKKNLFLISNRELLNIDKNTYEMEKF